MRATFDLLISQNPRLADATLTVLTLIAGIDRQRAMRLIEAVSTIVGHSPRKAPSCGSEEP